MRLSLHLESVNRAAANWCCHLGSVYEDDVKSGHHHNISCSTAHKTDLNNNFDQCARDASCREEVEMMLK